MLQVKSFKLSDGDAMSEHLRNYRIAEGASMLVSNGEIALPYEDGEPMNLAQRIIQLKVEKEEFEQKARLIIHSQLVLEKQNQGVAEKIDEEKAKVDESDKKASKEIYDTNKAAKKEIARLENVSNQTDNQILMNNAELTRIMLNVKVYEETIAALSQ